MSTRVCVGERERKRERERSRRTIMEKSALR